MFRIRRKPKTHPQTWDGRVQWFDPKADDDAKQFQEAIKNYIENMGPPPKLEMPKEWYSNGTL